MRGCAGCGRIFAIDDLTIYELGPDLKHLRKDAAFAAQWRAKAPWHRAAHHIVEHGGELYAVAPTLMKYGRWVGHGQYKGDQWYGHFCDKCMKEECPRNHSRFADFDFGVPYTPFLTYGEQWPLTSLNRVAIAPCIQYLVHVKLYATTGYVRLLERGARSPHRSRAPISAEYSLARSHDPPPAVVQARGLDGAKEAHLHGAPRRSQGRREARHQRGVPRGLHADVHR